MNFKNVQRFLFRRSNPKIGRPLRQGERTLFGDEQRFYFVNELFGPLFFGINMLWKFGVELKTFFNVNQYWLTSVHFGWFDHWIDGFVLTLGKTSSTTMTAGVTMNEIHDEIQENATS